MSTVLNTNGETLKVPRTLSEELEFFIITADWNPEITHALRDGAVETLRKAGVKPEGIRLIGVPGTVELVNAASVVINERHPAGVIIIGCVIRGDTPHFDYVCLHTANGASLLNAAGDTPVTFGVLTVDDMQQALDRAGGRLGNKGAEAACAAVEMANLHLRLKHPERYR